MVTLAVICAVAACAVAAWFTAAFILRWQHDARCAATVLSPAAVATGIALKSFFGARGFSSEEAGWNTIFCILSLFIGAFASMVTLPVWLVLEQRFGWRAR